jgi:hypothetical protein
MPEPPLEPPLESVRVQVDNNFPETFLEVEVIEGAHVYEAYEETFVGAPTPPPQMPVVIVNVRESTKRR